MPATGKQQPHKALQSEDSGWDTRLIKLVTSEKNNRLKSFGLFNCLPSP